MLVTRSHTEEPPRSRDKKGRPEHQNPYSGRIAGDRSETIIESAQKEALSLQT